MPFIPKNKGQIIMSWMQKHTAVYLNEQGFNLCMCQSTGTESSW